MGACKVAAAMFAHPHGIQVKRPAGEKLRRTRCRAAGREGSGRGAGRHSASGSPSPGRSLRAGAGSAGAGSGDLHVGAGGGLAGEGGVFGVVDGQAPRYFVAIQLVVYSHRCGSYGGIQSAGSLSALERLLAADKAISSRGSPRSFAHAPRVFVSQSDVPAGGERYLGRAVFAGVRPDSSAALAGRCPGRSVMAATTGAQFIPAGSALTVGLSA